MKVRQVLGGCLMLAGVIMFLLAISIHAFGEQKLSPWAATIEKECFDDSLFVSALGFVIFFLRKKT